MPVGDIYQLSVDQMLYGQNLMNVHYFRQISPDPAGGAAASLVAAFISDIQPSLLACQSQEISIIGYRAIRVSPIPSQVYIETIPPANGLIAEQSHSANVAAITSFYGDPASASLVIRNFIAGITLPSAVQGLIINATLSLLATYTKNLLANITDGTTASDWKKVAYNAGTDTVTELVQAIPRPATRKKRSRQKGVGS